MSKEVDLEKLTKYIKHVLGYPIIDVGIDSSLVKSQLKIAEEDFEMYNSVEGINRNMWLKQYTCALTKNFVGFIIGRYGNNEHLKYNREELRKESKIELQKLLDMITPKENE